MSDRLLTMRHVGDYVGTEGAGGHRVIGCASCSELQPDGHLVLELDDGEYFPSVCFRCILLAILDGLGSQHE